jgi:hypothetical protein
MAPWIGLVLPRVLMRLPYGAATDPISGFAFEEMPPSRPHEAYLWGAGSQALAQLAGRAFMQDGWDLDLDAARTVEDLPSHVVTEDGQRVQQPGAEVLISEQAASAIAERGPMRCCAGSPSRNRWRRCAAWVAERIDRRAPQETRVAVVENGAVQELHIERTLERGLVGNVYLGKVARVLPGMQSAFIDIGLERAAFLHVADLHFTPGNGRARRPAAKPDAPQVPIERQVFEGQTLTVQVIKDAIGTKGARLSTQVSIAGRMLVFLPHDNHIGISQKIGSHELREQLRARMQALVGKPEDGGGGGFILRTNAEEASDTELADDIAYLRKRLGADPRAQRRTSRQARCCTRT